MTHKRSNSLPEDSRGSKKMSKSEDENYYNVLQNDVTEPEPSTCRRTIAPTRQTKSTDQSATKVKLPPITIFGLHIVSVKTRLCQIKNINFNTLQIKITQHGIQVFSSNIEQYTLIHDYCKNNQIQFHTHTLRDNRKIKICLYGLWQMSINDLQKELNQLGVVPCDIKKIEIKKKKYEDQCIYLLYFLKKSNIKIATLRQTKAVFNCVVRWEYYSPKIRGPTQCSNCQDFGHGSENCYRTSRCIRCGDQHNSAVCPHLPLPPVDEKGNEIPNFVPKIPAGKIKCANCNLNHTANFKGCPSRKSYVDIQNKVKSKNHGRTNNFKLDDTDQFPSIPPPSRPIGNNSWKNAPHRQNALPNYLPQSHNQLNDLFSAEDCYNIMNEFIQKLSNCQNKQQQLQTIGEITFKYLYGSHY